MDQTRKHITVINLVGSAIFVGLTFDIPNLFIRFLFLGELPDGSTLLSPDTMLGIIALSFIATLILISPVAFFKSFSKLASSSTKLHLPKRRYTSL
jgi:hypothetical protein